MQYYNTLSAKERAILIDKAGKSRITLSFYQYTKISDPQKFRDHLFAVWSAWDILGRIYVAHEGINAQLSLPSEALEGFKNHLESIAFLKGVRLNMALEQNDKSFLKLKIKVREKIVADGLDDADFDVTDRGVHLDAVAFNEIAKDEETIVVDMRNHYESEIGHFKEALIPNVDTFRESLEVVENELKAHKEDKNIVMYCTGGIRCEKASAYFKHKGFKKVYQLNGGIIEYARQVKENHLENRFLGQNFVFDSRMAERISGDVIAQCHQCGAPFDIHTNCANEACHLLFIQCPKCKKIMENCCSTNCMEISRLSYEEQKALRKGRRHSNTTFKKGRVEHLSCIKQ